MRVLALGGSGGMGRYAVRVAHELDGLYHIVVADLHAEAASDSATSLGENVEGMGLDVADEDALRAAMQPANVVLNCVGRALERGGDGKLSGHPWRRLRRACPLRNRLSGGVALS